MSAATERHLAEYAAFHASYPSLVSHLRSAPASAPRNHALEERVAEIKAEIVSETPYLWNKSDRHHSEDIHEHLQYHAPLAARFATLIRDACRGGVSDAEIGLSFSALMTDAIEHQARVDLEKASDESDDTEADDWYRTL